MKRSVKANAKRGGTRDLFAELSEGMEALAYEREGKRTLRTYSTEIGPAAEVLAQKPFGEIVEPIARSFDESGMSEDERDELINQTAQKVRSEKRRKQLPKLST